MTKREQLLDRAGMAGFTDPAPVLAELDAALQARFEDTNRAIAEGLNPHFKMLAGKAFRVSTPKQDEEESKPLRHFFPERHYVPLTEILATVNLHTEFTTELRHLRQTHVRHVSEKILFAGVIGLGCAIGSPQMAQISTSVGAAELDSAINWRFSLDNLCAANDRITGFMAAMELPNIYRRSGNEIHTASDGQKFEVRADSLNANHSFKYFGKGQGISAYTFVDERNLFWHSLVFSAAERESAYVIDGLMRNDVVKSDIHSTDTHGFSEAIFAVTHLLGCSFAPRIKNLKKAESLYVSVAPGRRPRGLGDKTRAIRGSGLDHHRLGRRPASCRHHKIEGKHRLGHLPAAEFLLQAAQPLWPQLMKRPAGTHKRTESERHAALAASSGAGWSGVNPALFSVIYCPVIVRCGFRRSPPVCAENLSGAVSARYLIPT